MDLINVSKICLHMDVLCVTEHSNLVFAGIGNYLFVYKNQIQQYCEQIFIGERIHSMYIKKNLLLLKGGRELAIVLLPNSSDIISCQVICKIKCNDWIQDAIILEKSLISLTTAHNFFQIWDLESIKCLKELHCEEKCILYSCKIIEDTQDNVVVFSGTVFGDILIWMPCSENNTPLLKRLRGHEGAVFSLEINLEQKVLCTTSDDRSLKVWSVQNEDPDINWRDIKIQLIHTLFGHTARVWRSLIISNFYITIGEDSKLIIWSKDGKLLKTLTLHQGSGIRALHYSKETDTIATGGEDGGINMISWSFLKSETKPTGIINFELNFSVKVCFTKNGLAYTQKGGCVMVSAGEEVVYRNENFDSYCLMEVSSTGDYIILGSISGHLVVIDVYTNIAVLEGRFLDGRVYSIHWLDERILTCGPEGKLDLWIFSNGELKNLKTMILPSCKERWTTCGVIHNNYLAVGDRMGNLHVFDLKKESEPTQSFRKIHSHLGVTDIKTDGSTIFTIGRDGTIKTFSENLNQSLTQKLPIEWPWKILKYSNDKLILGFHGVFFIVWSTKHREIIASHDCGGGHRSCDFKLKNNYLTFMYVKEKKVLTVELNLDEIIKIRSGFHSKEINCLKILQSSGVIVTGSEDTTVRISRIVKSEIEEIDVLKTHTSSVRALGVWSDPQKILIVSAGGKGQIILWSFDLNTNRCQEIVNHFLRKEKRDWKSLVPDIDPDTRFMCVCIVKAENEFIIAAGCSDCQVRIFSYEKSLKLLFSVSYSHCILKIEFLQVNLKLMLVTMGTDGMIVFWDMSDSNLNKLQSFTLHQSGINSFQFVEVNPGRFILATGGDDNLIQVSLIQISQDEISLSQLWKNCTTHSCQITGIKILKHILITTSIDQRITVWNWAMNEDGFKMEFVDQYMTAVPDIQGMDSLWQENGSILLAVYGKGIELLRIGIAS